MREEVLSECRSADEGGGGLFVWVLMVCSVDERGRANVGFDGETVDEMDASESFLAMVFTTGSSLAFAGAVPT